MRALHRKYVKSGFAKKPKQMTDWRYQEILSEFFADNEAHRDEFILGFVMLVVSIAGRWASKFPMKQNDILGVAYVTLMECVDRTIEDKANRTFDTFSAYLHVRVRGAIINMIRTDYVVRPPANSEWFIKRAAELGSDAYKPFIGIAEVENDISMFAVEDRNFDFSEVELLESPWFTSDEKIALQMRLNGKKHADIARALALTRSRVTQLFLGMRERVEEIVKGRV